MTQVSGPNQHFLPRFLQRGFASRNKGKNPFVFHFQRDGAVTERQINDIGADEYFYGDPSVSPVDEQLKVHEDRFGAMVARLRKSKTSEEVPDPLVAELFAHMTIRTKNLRDNFRMASEHLMYGLADVSETSAGEAYLQRRIEAELDSELSKILTQEPYRTLMSQMEPAAREQLIGHVRSQAQNMNLAAAFAPAIRQFAGMLDFKTMTNDAHVKALAKIEGGLAGHIDALKPLTWKLVVRPVGEYVLGDIGVMAQNEPNGLLQSPLKEKGTPYAILLPISDKHLLVGGGNDESFNIDPETVNEASAELSVDFFIASRNTVREQGYAARFGKRGRLLANDEMDDLLQSVVGGN